MVGRVLKSRTRWRQIYVTRTYMSVFLFIIINFFFFIDIIIHFDAFAASRKERLLLAMCRQNTSSEQYGFVLVAREISRDAFIELHRFS